MATFSSEYIPDPKVALILFSFRLLFGWYNVNTNDPTKLCDDGYALVSKGIANTDQLFGLSNRSCIATNEMTNFAFI